MNDDQRALIKRYYPNHSILIYEERFSLQALKQLDESPALFKRNLLEKYGLKASFEHADIVKMYKQYDNDPLGKDRHHELVAISIPGVCCGTDKTEAKYTTVEYNGKLGCLVVNTRCQKHKRGKALCGTSHAKILIFPLIEGETACRIVVIGKIITKGPGKEGCLRVTRDNFRSEYWDGDLDWEKAMEGTMVDRHARTRGKALELDHAHDLAIDPPSTDGQGDFDAPFTAPRPPSLTPRDTPLSTSRYASTASASPSAHSCSKNIIEKSQSRREPKGKGRQGGDTAEELEKEGLLGALGNDSGSDVIHLATFWRGSVGAAQPSSSASIDEKKPISRLRTGTSGRAVERVLEDPSLEAKTKALELENKCLRQKDELREEGYKRLEEQNTRLQEEKKRLEEKNKRLEEWDEHTGKALEMMARESAERRQRRRTELSRGHLEPSTEPLRQAQPGTQAMRTSHETGRDETSAIRTVHQSPPARTHTGVPKTSAFPEITAKPAPLFLQKDRGQPGPSSQIAVPVRPPAPPPGGKRARPARSDASGSDDETRRRVR